MFLKVLLFISVIHCGSAASYILESEDYQKSKSDSNKIVSKGIWINSNLKEDQHTKSNGDFIFRPNSLDVDNLLQNNFDAFGDSFMQDNPALSSYIGRNKRASDYEKKKVFTDSVKCNGDKNCSPKKQDDKSFKSKMMSKLKPASVFNDYPYEVAIMLGDNTIDTPNIIRKVKDSGNVLKLVMPIGENKEQSQIKIDPLLNKESKIGNVIKYNNTESASITPKRSMKHDYESELIKKIEYTEEIDKITDNNNSNKLDKNIFDKQDRIWYHSDTPVKTRQNINRYNVEPQRNKQINERGLVKIISMLTKTFKKIMKQHSDITKIHTKLNNLNDEVTKNIEDITKKFADIEQKYSHIVDMTNKMKQFESKMESKEEYFKIKDKEIANHLEEFENQQKKFLTQQQQFYNIQKLMLAQNEKINMKQNLIAKTQSDISHRQYNFARVLKKAKQIYIDNKYSNTIKPVPKTSQPPTSIVATSTETANNINFTTTQESITDSIKINLFSIPALNKLVNQDSQILKDKDAQTVDDLVYKYYFNNTFIDNVMKSRILANFISNRENTEIARNTKTKRDEDIIENTILLPVRKIDDTLNREKRWIRHAQSKSKLKRKLRGKKYVDGEDFKDEKPIRQRNHEMTNREANKLFSVKAANDPFLIMAKSFCNEIGQNTNDQMLHWCMEKALRRLQTLEQKLPLSMPIPLGLNLPKTIGIPVNAGDLSKNTILINNPTTVNLPKIQSTGNEEELYKEVHNVSPSTVSSMILFTPSSSVTTQIPAESTTNAYFPDNDELELNLQQYELKPDPEGTVYFDGSVHTSDILMEDEAEGISDIMPGLDSNSRVEMDPLTLDFQAMRKDPMRRLAELKKIAYG